MTEIRLTDTQLVALSAASQRPDLSLHPLPEKLRGGAATKVVSALIGKGLAERVDGQFPDQPLERISRKGLDAIGVEVEAEDGNASPDQGDDTAPAADQSEPEAGPPAIGTSRQPRPGTKLALLIEMLRRPEGATIAEVVADTGWQTHTVRGAIAGSLKKKLGLTVTSEKIEERGRVYRIPAAD